MMASERQSLFPRGGYALKLKLARSPNDGQGDGQRSIAMLSAPGRLCLGMQSGQ